MIDIKNLDPRSLTTVEQCTDALWELERAVATIDTQLRYANDYRQENGAYKNKQWYLAAKAALDINNAKLRAVRARREDMVKKFSAALVALREEFGNNVVDDALARA